MGIGGTISSITGILVPYVVGVVTPNVSSSSLSHSYRYERERYSNKANNNIYFIVFFFVFFFLAKCAFIAMHLIFQQGLLTEWRGIFWITLILQMLKLVIFSIWGSGDVQPWDAHPDCDASKLLNDDDDVSDCEVPSTGTQSSWFRVEIVRRTCTTCEKTDDDKVGQRAWAMSSNCAKNGINKSSTMPASSRRRLLINKHQIKCVSFWTLLDQSQLFHSTKEKKTPANHFNLQPSQECDRKKLRHEIASI